MITNDDAAGANQRPIVDQALLSDCHSAALVDGDGCISWYCPSRFDGPSLFAALLDPSAGEWRLRPSGGEFDAITPGRDRTWSTSAGAC